MDDELVFLRICLRFSLDAAVDYRVGVARIFCFLQRFSWAIVSVIEIEIPISHMVRRLNTVSSPWGVTIWFFVEAAVENHVCRAEN